MHPEDDEYCLDRTGQTESFWLSGKHEARRSWALNPCLCQGVLEWGKAHTMFGMDIESTHAKNTEASLPTSRFILVLAEIKML